MKPCRPVFSLAIFLSALLLITDVSAQLGGPFGGGMRGGRGGNHGNDAPGGGRESRVERPAPAADQGAFEQVDYRLTLLQEDLKLTAEQAGAWQAFADKTRAYAGDLIRERTRATTANAAQAGGLQHIEQAVDAAQNRLTALQDVETAAKALYRLLVREQKILADARILNIVSPRPPGIAERGNGGNLPDMGAGARPTR